MTASDPGQQEQETAAAGFRLLAVVPEARGKGAGRALATACIERARAWGHRQVL
ncbi:MAG: GNAT family N-acetyltransferase, partial [Chloroflexota bacterium]